MDEWMNDYWRWENRWPNTVKTDCSCTTVLHVSHVILRSQLINNEWKRQFFHRQTPPGQILNLPKVHHIQLSSDVQLLLLYTPPMTPYWYGTDLRWLIIATVKQPPWQRRTQAKTLKKKWRKNHFSMAVILRQNLTEAGRRRPLAWGNKKAKTIRLSMAHPDVIQLWKLEGGGVKSPLVYLGSSAQSTVVVTHLNTS